MSDAQNEAELAKFTEAVAGALFRAVNSQPTNRAAFMDDFAVTAGIWLDTRTPPRNPFTPRDLQERTSTEISTLSTEELSRLRIDDTINRSSVGRLNDVLQSDPKLGLRLMKTLCTDPQTWGELFILDRERQDSLRNARAPEMAEVNRFIDRLGAFGDDLGGIVIEVNVADSGVETRALSEEWWKPDKFELSGEGGSGGWKVGGKLTWEF